MKKSLFSVSSLLLLTFPIFGQTIVNGDCESPLIPMPGLAGNNSSDGWIGFELRGESANPHSGAQAYYVETTNDPTLAGAIGISSGIVPGIAINSYKGPMSNPQNVTVNFWYMYSPVNGDYATIEVTILDTMATGTSDNVKLYQGRFTSSTAVTAWANGTVSLTPTGSTGTPNRLDIVLVSSTAGSLIAGTPSEGSKLWFDDFTLSTGSNAGLATTSIQPFEIFPNPVNDYLKITLNDNYTSMELLSADGKLIYQQEISASNLSVDFSSYPKGSYYLKLMHANGTVETTKLTK